MGSKKCRAILIITAFCMSVLTTHATANKLKLGYIEFPPYTYTDKNGIPQGSLIDLASKVFPAAGYEWSAVSYPVRRLATYIGSGDLDIWIGLKTLPEFKGKAYIGNTIITELILRAYTRGDMPPIIKKEELMGKSVIIMRGYSYGGWITFIENPQNNINFIKTNKHAAAFNMLKAGRADYLLDYEEPSEMALSNISIPDLKFNQISSLPCYFIVSGKRLDGQKIINRLEATYEIMKKDDKL